VSDLVLGVDGTRLVGRRTGVGRVLEHLLRTWATQELPFRLVRVAVPVPLDDIAGGAQLRFDVVEAAARSARWQAGGARAWTAGIDVLFSPYTLPLAYRGPGVVWSLGIQEPRFRSRSPRGRLRVWHFRHSARRAAAVIANSSSTKEAVVRFYDVDPSKVHVIWPGVGGPFGTVDQAARGEDHRAVETLLGTHEPYLLYVGKLTPRRNVLPLLEAFASLRDRFPSLQLVLVGPNTGGFDLPQIGARLGVRERIRHIPHLEQAELGSLYRDARAFVLPTEQEGFSGTIPEALACGCPVIALAHPALSEAGLASAVLELRTVDELAGALARAVADEDLRADLAARGPAAVQGLSWDRSAAETASLIAAVARGAQR
jgi:glycosyltransferase involved in cell wall biosynthesis